MAISEGTVGKGALQACHQIVQRSEPIGGALGLPHQLVYNVGLSALPSRDLEPLLAPSSGGPSEATD